MSDAVETINEAINVPMGFIVVTDKHTNSQMRVRIDHITRYGPASPLACRRGDGSYICLLGDADVEILESLERLDELINEAQIQISCHQAAIKAL